MLGSEGEFVVIIRSQIRPTCTSKDLEEHVVRLLFKEML
jgi:hypothetical protein